MTNFPKLVTKHTAHSQKAADLNVILSRGWCTNCQNLREQQNIHHPQDCNCTAQHGLCGGGVQIVGFDNYSARRKRGYSFFGHFLVTFFVFSVTSGEPLSRFCSFAYHILRHKEIFWKGIVARYFRQAQPLTRRLEIVGGVPTTPDPNTEKVSQFKWEAYRAIHWWCIYCQEWGILLQKHGDRNARCIPMLLTSIGVRGQFASPESLNVAISARFSWGPRIKKQMPPREDSNRLPSLSQSQVLKDEHMMSWSRTVLFRLLSSTVSTAALSPWQAIQYQHWDNIIETIIPWE